MTEVKRDGSGSPPRLRGAGCSQRGAAYSAEAAASAAKAGSPAANQTSGGRGRAWFIVVAAAYGAWLVFLAVLAVIQKMR